MALSTPSRHVDCPTTWSVDCAASVDASTGATLTSSTISGVILVIAALVGMGI